MAVGCRVASIQSGLMGAVVAVECWADTPYQSIDLVCEITDRGWKFGKDRINAGVVVGQGVGSVIDVRPDTMYRTRILVSVPSSVREVEASVRATGR